MLLYAQGGYWYGWGEGGWWDVGGVGSIWMCWGCLHSERTLPQFQQQKKSLNFILDSMKKDPGNLLTESLYQTWIL